jgi:two-component sensor histidine kinase
MLVPENRIGEEASILDRIRAGRQVEPYETVRRRKDGSLVPVSVSVSPIIGSNGEILGASNITRSIEELVREREQRELLLREMNHRVKNLFAVTTGIVNMSARAAGSPVELAAKVTERLTALGRAHSLTQIDAQSPHSISIPIRELCRIILQPYDEEGASRISFSGDNCEIESKLITPLALLFHEFATNAAKHGSLSKSDGRVEIKCTAHQAGIDVLWTEKGSISARPGSTGFGTRLVNATVAQLGGRIEHHWRESGLEIKFELPYAQSS